MPAGTRIRLVARGDRELAGGWVRFGSGGARELEASGHDIVEHEFVPEESGFLDLALKESRWSLESQPPARFALLVFPDQEPAISFDLPAESRFMTPSGKLPYRIEARDDHGFSALTLEMTKLFPARTASGEEPAVERFDLDWTEERGEATEGGGDDSGGVMTTVESELDLEPMGLAPGSSVTLQAAVSDNDALTGPKTTRSQKETILILDAQAFRNEMDKLRLAAQAKIESMAEREQTLAASLEAAERAPAERLAAEQAEVAEEASKVVEGLEQMVDALRRNQLMRAGEERHFRDEVTAPLGELARDRLPRSAAAIGSLAESGKQAASGEASEERAEARREAERIAEALEDVAASLAGSGDLSEILGRLELIIELQREVIEETEKEAE